MHFYLLKNGPCLQKEAERRQLENFREQIDRATPDHAVKGAFIILAQCLVASNCLLSEHELVYQLLP